VKVDEDEERVEEVGVGRRVRAWRKLWMGEVLWAGRGGE